MNKPTRSAKRMHDRYTDFDKAREVGNLLDKLAQLDDDETREGRKARNAIRSQLAEIAPERFWA